MFDTESLGIAKDLADSLDIEPAALLAIAEVESGGRAYAMVDGRREPLIRFEGHYFDRRLSGAKRAKARAASLSSPVAGAVANPLRQEDRWKLLRAAAVIDHVAAHESVSWGIGQVMGAHWRWLGFGSVDQLVAEARSGVAGQLRLMCRYIEKAGLSSAIRDRDWKAFARGYNGPAYAASGYHRKIAAAYRRHSHAVVARDDPLSGVPAEIEDLQRMLSAAGYPVTVDGLMGPQTRTAIRSFQRASGLAADGVAGPLTLAVLRDAQPLGRAGDSLWTRIKRLLSALFASA